MIRFGHMSTITTRFAPSPTGLLHLGHVYAAAQARRAGGRFLLRLEDIDQARCHPVYAAAIIEDLTWLGFHWDGEVRTQSEHMEAYAKALNALADLLYPCFCTRAEILREVAQAASAPHAPDGAPVYPGLCRYLSADERQRRIRSGAPYALRLDMQRAAAGRNLWFEEVGQGRIACNPAAFGDVILARRDCPASYHLCVTHDDALQGVTLVTRGMDLQPATSVHRLLQDLLGWPTPAYAHHRLLTDETGRRLSKRDAANTVRALRDAGLAPADVRAASAINASARR
jgi:glutamyl-Q tRNA(Asp) synthetase